MINVLTAMMLNILTGASQLGGAQRSGLTAIVSVCLFVRLCEEYSGPRRIDGVRHECWTLFTRAILNNAVVMERTTLQLPVMISATIATW